MRQTRALARGPLRRPALLSAAATVWIASWSERDSGECASSFCRIRSNVKVVGVFLRRRGFAFDVTMVQALAGTGPGSAGVCASDAPPVRTPSAGMDATVTVAAGDRAVQA